MMFLCLSYDHRLVDGAYAAQFMAQIKSNLESWDEQAVRAVSQAAPICTSSGVTPYGDALATMTDLAAARGQGAVPDTVMLLEHEPVITLGSRAVRGEELLMAASSTRAAASRWSRSAAAAAPPTTAPGSWSATRSSTCGAAARICTATSPTWSR